MAYRRNSKLHQLAHTLEKRADFLDDAREWIYDNPELAAGLLGGAVGAGGGALVPTEDGAGGRVRNALIGALLGGGLGAGAGYLGSDQIKDLMFGNGEKTRQFDKDLEALTGKKFSGGKEVVDDPTALKTGDASFPDQDGSLTIPSDNAAERATQALLGYPVKLNDTEFTDPAPFASSLLNLILSEQLRNATYASPGTGFSALLDSSPLAQEAFQPYLNFGK